MTRQTIQEQTMTTSAYRVQVTEFPDNRRDLGGRSPFGEPRYLAGFKSVKVRGLGTVRKPQFAMTAEEGQAWTTHEAAQRNADRLHALGYTARMVDA